MKIELNYNNLLEYLFNVNLCTKKNLENLQIDVKYSKSNHWKLNLPSDNIIIKQGPDKYDHINSNLISNEHYIYELMPSCTDLFYTSLLTPTILHFDELNSILIYKYSSEYINLESYYEDKQDLPTSIAKLVGHTLASLHYETRNSDQCSKFFSKYQDNFKYTFPYYDYIVHRIEPEKLSKFPVEALRFLAFYQRYEKLKSTIVELMTNQSYCCLTHNSLLLNKILIHKQSERLLSKGDYFDNSLIKLIDWESLSWGDPACDLGITVAGYLLIWINSITVHPAIELEQSLKLATIPLERISPSIVAMLKAYIKTYPKVLEHHPDFLKRVIQFAGLGLIYKILNMLKEHNFLNNQLICMMEIGKNLLCQPDKSFRSVVGTTQSDIIDAASHSNN